MSTAFGPQLIGETEKALNAILERLLEGTELSESSWVVLRLAEQLGATDRAALVDAVIGRAHLADTDQLVAELTERGLLERGQLTNEGRDLLTRTQELIATTTAPIWTDLPSDDVAAAERVLREVARRGRDVLGASG